eukprot:TRINITY_DN1888_c0_g1_i2.p1 TRINITY_DN1888_c0_g1~~TRINITY_DN1888_c0_g1_i2.p1  ORF type:complete len:124 (+),score=25.39 TRINITY_DN1888_c0_g1_i2:461-832(+)
MISHFRNVQCDQQNTITTPNDNKKQTTCPTAVGYIHDSIKSVISFLFLSPPPLTFHSSPFPMSENKTWLSNLSKTTQPPPPKNNNNNNNNNNKKDGTMSTILKMSRDQARHNNDLCSSRRKNL